MNDEEKNKILCMGARGTCGFAGLGFISGPWALFRGFSFLRTTDSRMKTDFFYYCRIF